MSETIVRPTHILRCVYGPLYRLFDNYFEYEDGFLKVPQEPGLGLIVNEQEMEQGKVED